MLILIADGALVARLLAEHSPGAVVNFAAEAMWTAASTKDFIQTSVVGTFRLLEAVRGY